MKVESKIGSCIRRTLRLALDLILVALPAATAVPAIGQGGTAPPGTRAVQLPLSARQAGGVGVQQHAPVPSGASANVQVQIPGDYSGSVPQSSNIPASLDLTLAEAVQRGLRANLGLISADISVQAARAQRLEARSALLPGVSVNASENAAKLNLAAEGFSASAFGISSLAFPTSVGPYHYYDLHGSLQQSLLDVTALRNFRAQGKASEAAVLEAHQAREEVVLAVTGVYLQLMADLALVERQRAEVAYAQESYQQASAQAEAGNKAPIEASRSLVEFQTEEQRLRSQLGEVAKRRMQLARLIGLPLGTQMQPKERFDVLVDPLQPLQDAIQRAWSQRLDLQATAAQLQSAEQARKAASAERLPSVALNGTYGIQGVNPNQGVPVFQAAVSLNLPVYLGGRIEADTAQADAVVRQRQAELAEERSAVESDVRTAYIDLQVANDQVTLAASNHELATRTLQQSQDRFAVGIADSVEVVSSQQSLAAADHDYVNSLFAQHVAKVTLAHAMGEAEQDLSALFERKTP